MHQTVYSYSAVNLDFSSCLCRSSKEELVTQTSSCSAIVSFDRSFSSEYLPGAKCQCNLVLAMNNQLATCEVPLTEP